MTNTSDNIRLKIIFSALVLIFLFLTLGNIILGHFSITYDEASHFLYGKKIYRLDPNRFDDSKMPVSVFNFIPVRIAERFFRVTFTGNEQMIHLGRISTVIFSLLLAGLCFLWIRSIYGKWVGLVGFGLYLLEPNIIAHSQLVTTDIYAAASATLALYVCWRFFESPQFKRGFLLGLALGLCQISKYSGIFLYPIVLLLACIRYAGWLRAQFVRKSWQNLKAGVWVFVKYGCLILAVSILVINIGFVFDRFGTPLRGYQFLSDFFLSLQRFSPILRRIPIPLPYPYVEGLDAVMFRERTGGGHGPIYLLGELSGNGFPGYYFIAALFKVPIPILALLLVSIWDWVRSFRMHEFISQDMFLLIPALLYLIYFNYFYQAQIGIRFLLVIFPLLLIFSARFFRRWDAFPRRARIFWGLAGCYLMISVASYYPDHISYFNEFVLNRTDAYRYLADSNLDWGQNSEKTAEFLSRHPHYHFNPTGPTAGTLIVSVNEYLGILGAPEDFEWLRDHFEPVGNLYRTNLVFDISPSDLAQIGY